MDPQSPLEKTESAMALTKSLLEDRPHAEDEAVKDLKRHLREAHDGATKPGIERANTDPAKETSNRNLPNPEIGRVRDLAKPGGFRRQHIQEKGAIIEEITLVQHLLPRLRAQDLDEDMPKVLREADASNAAVAFVIAKNFFGSCFMVTPKGFEEAGLFGGPLCLILVYLMEVRCMLNLIKCRNETKRQKEEAGEEDGEGEGGDGEGYEHLGVAVFPSFPALITGMILLCQFGFVCIWLVCNAQNLGMVFPEWSITLRLWIQFPLLFALVWVRKLSYFAYTNLIGIIFTCFLVVFFFWFMSDHIARCGAAPTEIINTQNANLFLWLGTCAYAYEGINIVLPTYESAKDKKTMPKLLVGITSITTITYITFGMLAYTTLGTHVASMVSLNLSRDTFVGKAIPMTSVVIGLASIPLQAFVVFQTYEPKLTWSQTRLVRTWQKNIARSSFLMFSVFMTWLGGDQLQNFLALVGGVCCASLALIFPSILYIYICKPRGLALVLDWFIFCFGVFILCLSTYQALESWGVHPKEDTSDHCPATSGATYLT